jgi:serine/threonine protein kinase
MSQSNPEEVPQPGGDPPPTGADARAETVDARNRRGEGGTASRTDATARSPRVVAAMTATGVLDQLSTRPPPVIAVGTDPGVLPADARPPGSRLGQYELVRQIGRGGMGTVHLARDLRLGRLVALKLLSRLGHQDNERFLTEARVTARCNHDNIVVIHDVGEHDGQPYMVFEYVAGQTLRTWLDDRTQRSSDGVTPIEPSLAASLMVPVARALAYAHDMGIVHRDLKPANIMLTDAGTIKVLDFGIAKLVVGDDPGSVAFHLPLVSEPGVIMGTLPYMSPEQLEGAPVDHRTDLWAVGIMLYQMVTGAHPVIHDGANLQRALIDIASLDVAMPGVEVRRSDLGPLAGIIDRCLLKDREHRTRDAHVLLEELEVIAAGRRVAVLRDDGNPFAGLAAFQETDADRFYGRSREIGAVVARLRSSPLIALAGPSGVGKSSLVRAGVIPALKRSGEGWDTFIVRPGRSPLASLCSILLDLASSNTAPIAAGAAGPDDLTAGLRVAPGQLGAALRAHAHSKRRRVLVFVDQFEELYTLCSSSGERAAFLACLDGVADDAGSPLRVLVSIRSDFLDRLAECRDLADRVSHGLMFVPPLDRDGLRDALIRPVEAADCRYEDRGMVDEMLDAVAAAPGSLPLLQFAAARLWTERDRDRRLLTRASYAAMGGIAGTLAGHADHVLGAIPAPERALVRSIFERMVTPERTRAVVSLSELRELPGNPDDIERLIYRLVDARLLVVEARVGGERAAELVHESLIGGWPTLNRWLDENRDDAAFLSRLRTAAAEWQASDHDEGVLWRGEPARQAVAWLAHYRGELGRRERAYLDAVHDIATRTERRRRLVRRQVIAAAVAVPVILLAVASVSLVRITRAERKARETADKLSTQTAELRDKKDALEQALKKVEADEAENRKLLVETQEASERAETERDHARLQEAAAEQAAREATRAARQAQIEKDNAEQAAREAQQAREAEAEAAERARHSEQDKKSIIDRAVGPIQRDL